MNRRFRYEALTAAGRRARGSIAALSAEAAAASIVARGDHPLRIVEQAAAPARIGRISLRDRAMLFRSLATLTGAAVPIVRALGFASELAPRRVALGLTEAVQQVREGVPLSAALEQVGLSSALSTGVIRAGEQAGRLADALLAVADQLDRESDLNAKVGQALTYPAVVSVTGLIALGVVGGVVLPRMTALLAELGQDVPPLAKLLVSLGALAEHALSPAGVSITVMCAAGGVAVTRWSAFRHRLAAVIVDSPIVGPIVRDLDTARLCRALGTAVGVGLPIHLALPSACGAMANPALRVRGHEATTLVLQGHALSAALADRRGASPLAVQLLAMGEASGDIPGAATRAAALCGDAAHRRIEAAVALIQPVLITLIAAAVGLVAAGLLQALYAVRPG